MRSPYPPMAGGSLRREIDKTIRLWPMPDMDQQPFHTLPYEELLERLRNVTNVRVVEDEAIVHRLPNQRRIAPFPGWEKVPEWWLK